jgi:hypothetical protein
LSDGSQGGPHSGGGLALTGTRVHDDQTTTDVSHALSGSLILLDAALTCARSNPRTQDEIVRITSKTICPKLDSQSRSGHDKARSRVRRVHLVKGLRDARHGTEVAVSCSKVCTETLLDVSCAKGQGHVFARYSKKCK